MHKLPLLLLATGSLLFLTCKDENPPPDCLKATADISGWTQEPLNESYSISFPAGFTDSGYTAVPAGYYFSKENAGSVEMFARYITASGWSVWVESNYDTGADSIPLALYSGLELKTVWLREKVTLCDERGTEPLGAFFYTLNAQADLAPEGAGLLLLKKDPSSEEYFTSVNVYFEAGREAEVLNIISSIRRK